MQLMKVAGWRTAYLTDNLREGLATKGVQCRAIVTISQSVTHYDRYRRTKNNVSPVVDAQGLPQ